ncbi:hypothetical protein F5878DRAFT_678207 [Lentinula raphanica]|uniref:Peptidase A2 domain-containing protein n=1 Tax=Lentinula raphanica TaxID=153919 RepID=A0AA38NV23_9AGAR|nr:hypothetical protein F5878DRAFT_678207 [Lentinula raphanica]
MQKLISEVARTCREYGKEMVSAIISQYEAEGEALVDNGYEYEEGQVSSGLCVAKEDRPRLQNFLHTYSSAVTQSTTKYYAMVTGVFEVVIGGKVFRAMIDTGSKLNIGAEDIPEKTEMPMDLEGMKWGLKGIHGEPEQLRGVIVDLPMKIGKYEFPHHLFVSRHQLNPNWDIILRQPFLQCKYRPVPTYFPDPVAQQFKPIPKTVPLILPENPPEWEEFDYAKGRMTKEHLEEMLGRIKDGILTKKEIDLITPP